DTLRSPNREGTGMITLTRRSALHSSAALAAATLVRPYIANAAATTATVWWTQGFAQEEDISFKKIVADYEKASGNTIDYSLVPYAPMRQKIVSAVTSGVVPDLFQNTPAEIIALYAWDNKLVDVSDIVEAQKEEFTETALLTAYCYNNVEKKRSYYGVPYTVGASMNHIWRPLVEKAGYSMEDLPKTWDAYYDFFKDVQKKLRAQGVRNVYGLGFQLNTTGNDSNARFNDFIDIVAIPLPLSNDGKPVPVEQRSLCGLVPKVAKNVEVAKDFLKYLIQPKVLNELLKTGLGRNLPAMPAIVKDDPWWFADPHRAAYTRQGLLGPTVPTFWTSNPAYAQVQNEHVWQTAWAEIMKDGATPQAAAEKAFKRVEEIFSKYPIPQG